MNLEFEDSPVLSFFVPGLPAPGGSKRGFAIKKGGIYTGRVAITDDAGARNKNWRACVAAVGSESMPCGLLRGPLDVVFAFVMPRPKGHYHTSKKQYGQLREDAPRFPTKKPDVLKLSRSTEDALTNVVWVDDAQTASLTATKIYGEKPGCQITIRLL